MRTVLGWCAVLVSSAILLAAAKPVVTPASFSKPSHWSNERFGFTLDLPDGWQADTVDAPVWLLGPRGQSPFPLAVRPDGAPLRIEGMSDAKDTLTAFVRQRFTSQCDVVGTDVERYPEQLRSLRRYRSPNGNEVVEFTSAIVEEPGGDYDSEDRGAEADGAAEDPEKGAPDQEKTGSRRFIVGPAFLVDLSRPGRPLRIWILPQCGEPTSNETTEIARLVMKSLRRI